MQSRLRHTALALAISLAISLATAALGACGGAVNETAASTTYNARFDGMAYFASIAPNVMTTPPKVLQASIVLSQLGATVSGTIALTDAPTDTVLTSGVTGHTTSSGIDLTLVQPTACAVTLSGPLQLQNDGGLDGVLSGADCHAAGAPDLQLHLSVTRR